MEGEKTELMKILFHNEDVVIEDIEQICNKHGLKYKIEVISKHEKVSTIPTTKEAE